MKVFPTYKYDGKDYTLPYRLPPGKSAGVQVSIDWKKSGTKLPVVSMRNALFMNLPRTELLIDAPLGIHTLRDRDGVWMTSLPQEIEQHSRQLASAKGRVLVGGLGLGVAVAFLEANEDVTEIIVVEKSFGVIQLVPPHLPRKKTTFFKGDLFDYLKEGKTKFDFAFYDIWRGTGELDFTKYVWPLRKLSKNIVSMDKLQCWNEDEMIGQIRLGCHTALMMYDCPKGEMIRGVLDAPDEKFEKFKTAHGMLWYFYRWLRSGPAREYAATRVDEFVFDLKDPGQFERKWMNTQER